MDRRARPLAFAALALASCVADDPDRTTDTLTTQASDTTTTDGTASESGDLESTGPLPGACTEASECRLANDCCACQAVHVDEDVVSCDLACDRPLCDVWGTTEVICSHTCLLRLVECDPALVECSDEPPTCDEGFLPSVEDRCWTRRCVPAELCVPF